MKGKKKSLNEYPQYQYAVLTMAIYLLLDSIERRHFVVTGFIAALLIGTVVSIWQMTRKGKAEEPHAGQ